MASVFVKFLALIVVILLIGIISNGNFLPIKSCREAYDVGDNILDLRVVDRGQNAYCTVSGFFIFMMVFVIIKALLTHPPGIADRFRKDFPVIFILICFIILLLPFFYFSLKGAICFNCEEKYDPFALARERERILLIQNSYLTDVNSASTEQDVRTALEFCHKLRYNREFCLKKIALNILPNHYNESLKICTDEQTFDINSREKKQAYCLLKISSILNSPDKEKRLETCDYGTSTNIIITCYSNMFKQFINESQYDTDDIVRSIIRKCEKGGLVQKDYCFKEVSSSIGKYALDNIRPVLYQICEKIESKTSRRDCFLNIRNSENVSRAEIEEFCKSDTVCIADSAYLLSKQKKTDDAILMCIDLPDTRSEQGRCLYNLFNDYNTFRNLEDTQEIFSLCKDVTDLQDWCYEEVAERFSFKSDERAVDSCAKIEGEKKRCVTKIVAQLVIREKYAIAKEACKLLEVTQEREECLKSAER